MSSEQTEAFRTFIRAKVGRDFRISTSGRHAFQDLNGTGDDLAVVTPEDITAYAFEFGLENLRIALQQHDERGRTVTQEPVRATGSAEGNESQPFGSVQPDFFEGLSHAE